MNFTYINPTTASTTPASVVNADGRAIVIRKILIGAPVASGNITVFYTNNALANNTTSIAYKKTFQSSFSSIQPETAIDFRASATNGGAVEEDGLPCSQGASICIDQAMQLCVLWDYAQE